MTRRRPSLPAAPADAQLAGTVFIDLVFTGLAAPPAPGRELRTSGLGTSPGGAANLAIALRRLGLTVRLDAAFSDDLYGDYLWQTLAEQEGVDLSGSRRFAGWATPVTVSLAYQADRGMITYERPQPERLPCFLDAGRPAPRSAFVHLGPGTPAWLERARAAGVRLFGDVGWDESERWASGDLAGLAHLEAFVPNLGEALAYTRTTTAEAAAARLLEAVPVVVVKCGADGAIGWRRGDPAPVHEPAIDVEAVDPTGAGDVFDAAFTFGMLAGWSLERVLRFGNLCAGLSVRHHGGSLSAPTWGEIADWLGGHPTRRPADPARYDFLRPYLDGTDGDAAPQRARPTI